MLLRTKELPKSVTGANDRLRCPYIHDGRLEPAGASLTPGPTLRHEAKETARRWTTGGCGLGVVRSDWQTCRHT